MTWLKHINQRGLTNLAVNELEQSRLDFQAVIQLFSEMEASKQVDKVNRAIERGLEPKEL